VRESLKVQAPFAFFHYSRRFQKLSQLYTLKRQVRCLKGHRLSLLHQLWSQDSAATAAAAAASGFGGTDAQQEGDHVNGSASSHPGSLKQDHVSSPAACAPGGRSNEATSHQDREVVGLKTRVHHLNLQLLRANSVAQVAQVCLPFQPAVHPGPLPLLATCVVCPSKPSAASTLRDLLVS